MASERRLYDTKTSLRRVHLTLGDMVDRPSRSARHFAKNEHVRRCWPYTCRNTGWKAVEGGNGVARDPESALW